MGKSLHISFTLSRFLSVFLFLFSQPSCSRTILPFLRNKLIFAIVCLLIVSALPRYCVYIQSVVGEECYLFSQFPHSDLEQMFSRHSSPLWNAVDVFLHCVTDLMQVVVFLPMIKHNGFIVMMPPPFPLSHSLHLSLFCLPSLYLFPPLWSTWMLPLSSSLSLQALTEWYWKGIIKAPSVPLQSYDFITVYSHWHIHTITHSYR